MQPIKEIEDAYTNPDPWGYKTNPEDWRRKKIILHQLDFFAPFERALDVGCGEGWITEDLPAKSIYGYEVSTNARSRWSERIRPYTEGQRHDLVVATGILYGHYDWSLFVRIINDCSSRYILTSSIKAWEVPEAVKNIQGKQILEMEFPYREFVQKLRIWEKS